MSTVKALGNPNQQWTKPYTAQGDCLIKKCGTNNIFSREFSSIPSDAEKLKHNLVLKGQTNSHALYGGKFELFQKDNVVFLKVEEPTILDHVKDLTSRERAEHHAQWIPVGEYFVDVVREYDHLLEASREVID